MSIHQLFEIHCDQNPLPNECREKLVLDVDKIPDQVWVNSYAQVNDWGVVHINNRDAHYCPKHRPVP
jgi:hypothetical protein